MSAPQKTAPQVGAAQAESTLEADQQRQVGKIFYADGHVDVHYENTRLRADHAEYDSESQVVTAHGNVQLDYMTQHIEAEEARYELRTGHGVFHHVRATFALQRHPSPTLLLSPNPLYFEAEQVDRIDEQHYKIRKAWLTVCEPGRPTWKFYAPVANVELRQSVHLHNGNFRLYSIPVVYLPYSTFPAEKRRDSGFMIPDPGHSSQKGVVLGDALYWAPLDWMDAMVGAAWFSRRGWSQRGDLRMKPWENARLDVTYFGVIDRGFLAPQIVGPPIFEKQGGHEDHLGFTALLPDGWRAVADLNQLTSLTFRLAFAETFTQAVNSEVHNAAFLTNNFDGFSLNFAGLSYRNFLSAMPQSTITLRTAPEARFSSVDQAPFRQLPLYFSFDVFTGAVHKAESVTPFATPRFISRSEFAPSVTMPFHWGPWLDVTPSFTLRSTYYGGQLENGLFVNDGFLRTTEEFAVDIRPPTIERVWERSETKWKHAIEPDIVYRLVNGVDHFSRFVRYDDDETLSDTSEIEYGITQRLYRRDADGDAEELVSWRLVEKYYFDPTFGGALVPGQRNVLQALDSLSPFAFADSPRNFSPIVSDLRIMPGKRYDIQFRVDFDPKRGQMTAIGELLKLKPYKESFFTFAHFSAINLPTPASENPPDFIFVPRSNQVRALVGYGDLTRRGWNATFGASYDLTQGEFQNQIVQVGYNGDCCGLGFEYRRLSFGTIRNDNQFRIVFLIANIGSAGNLRRQEKIF
ncbi:MAG TPA: LPS assembly protein LptD [Candidatus Sulfotelmatobacter sp.]|nr:LPS assembly protein LptD [Candidatus Sulfotelmatobacter sp.]